MRQNWLWNLNAIVYQCGGQHICGGGLFPQVLFFPKGLFTFSGAPFTSVVHCQRARHREADIILLERAADAQFASGDVACSAGAGSTEGNAPLELRSVTVGSWGHPEKNRCKMTSVCRQSISDSWLGNSRECLAHLV